jgi:hypothetical protein
MSKQRIIKDEMWSDDWFFELDPSEKLMWVFLLTNPRNNVAGVFNVSIAWISVHTGFTKEVVELILKRFVNEGKIIILDGWINIVNFKKHQSNSPSIVEGADRIWESVPENIREKIQGVPTLYTGCKRNIELSKVESGGVESSEVDHFETFWSEYPVKKTKKKAQQKFSKLKESVQLQIIEDVKKRKEHDQQWLSGYIPHPTTYLNGERWEDEIDTRQVGSKNKSVTVL